MKIKAILILAVSFITLKTFAQQKTETVKVWGVCESCEKTIEKTAKAAGASTASWSDSTFILTVSYDASKTTALAIQKAIAGKGYDTQDVKATEDAYNDLPDCCKYVRGGKPEDNKHEEMK